MAYDVIVLGAGPAGLAAAVAARGRNKTVLVVGNRWEDSPLARAERVDNYLGLPGKTGHEMLAIFQDHAREMGVEMPVGNLLSSDIFYAVDGKTMDWGKMGVLAVEMEAAALYLNAIHAKKKALCICTISDHIFTGESLSAMDRQVSFREMMEIALELA